MSTGRVLQFDDTRGYGFVAADDGGEDVFLHASVFDGDPGELIPGTKIEFQMMAGDRGRKAFGVRLAGEEPGPAVQERAPATAVAPVAPVAAAAPAVRVAAAVPAVDDEQMCDVLSQAEFEGEVSVLLLNAATALTGPQIVEARQIFLELARKHGWIDA